jgi:LPS-assembly protein
VGDANQLSLALTTRFINESTGAERFRFTLGQIRYFEDRTVTIGNSVVETDSSSDLIAEAVAYVSDEWSITSELQYDPSESETNLSSIGVRFRGENGGVFNITHRYRKDNVPSNPADGLELLDISAQIPIGKNWNLYARSFRDLENKVTLENLAGIEYQSCCWATRLLIRDYINDVDSSDDNNNDDDRNLAIYLEFEMKGLGSVGKKSDSLLESSIRGFQPPELIPE